MPSRDELQAPAPRVRYLELLSRAVAHIDGHIAEPLTGDLLAEQAAMSRFHFHRIFRAFFGTTVAGYITWRRLQRACELLAADPSSVLDVALAVGYDSAQALAKAMRRELDTTPTAVRAGAQPAWQRLFERRAAPLPDGDDAMLKPQFVDCPELHVLTATGRGMDNGDMTRAAKQGFGELLPAIGRAGLMPRMQSCLAMFPDEPQGKDDQQARMLTGAVFDHSLLNRSGSVARPEIELSGTLRWMQQPAGRYAVFTHIGPYSALHESWTFVYRDWLPATGYPLRDVPPFELYVTNPETTPPAQSRTDLYLPLE
jgi:AraC family transcriptional regulator